MDAENTPGLVREALAGDQTALTRLVAALTPVIQARVARTLLGHRSRFAADRNVRQEVEDLTQETFLSLFSKKAHVLRSWQVERGLSLENFVGMVSERLVVSFLRSGKRNPWKEDPSVMEDLDAAVPDRGPEEVAAGREQLRLLLDRLRETLSPLGRQLFELPLREGAVAAGGDGRERLVRRRRLRLAEPFAPPGSGAAGRNVKKSSTRAKDQEGRNSMSEDRLLHDLGHLAREEQGDTNAHLDERWDRLAAGTLTQEEDAELRALAESSPEARETYEAFRPLGAELQARIVESLAGELGKTAAEAKPKETRARLLPFRPVTLRRAGWLTAAAAAAGLFLLLRGPASMPPLPVYTAELSGGIKTFRGEESPPSGPPLFIPGSQVTLVVRPEHAVTGEVDAQAFLARGAEWIVWGPRIEIHDGSVRFQGELGREIQPGEWRLWAVVGRPGKLPSKDELLEELRAGRMHHEQWRAVHAELRIVHQPPP